MTATARPETAIELPQRERIRVAHVNANFYAGSGGITLREALALDRDRYESVIVAPAGGALFGRAEQEGLGIAQLRWFSGGRRVYPGADRRALRELEDVLAGFDVVHTHAGRAGALGRVAARRVGVSVVVHTLHGFPFNEFQPWWVRRGLLALERRLARLTDFFLTDGTFVASEAVRLGIAAPDRVRALVSSIDPVAAVSGEARRAARRVLGVPEGVRVVGTAARLARQKAPLDLVRAFAALPSDVWLVWLGDGELRGRVESLVSRLGLAGRVVLAGDRSDVGELLPAFDVFCLSSLWEGLPCSLVEAMSCGVPAVATAVNSVPELVVPGRTGLLARPGDPGSLAVGLRWMLEEPVRAAEMAVEARALVGQQYRPEQIGPDLMTVYETALARARAERTGVEAVAA